VNDNMDVDAVTASGCFIKRGRGALLPTWRNMNEPSAETLRRFVSFRLVFRHGNTKLFEPDQDYLIHC
jgi:hypothetical protein